ncbi:hypothetical protein EUGRSUZ_H01525 [Eucalyptus grandis]|uniref:RING-type E3 ubiquitin transferase n=4 Tax=Eucalyptus grandis TaxID=71139 RepID=A0A059AZ35_EUCGR|nr:hypothetical protein EUGRSUZ_H01525 [Eucalyptus grandis]KAK3415732.1 hypothetical protein EUGRSUZ_H01525 [Eucalyptus grandis]KAK3415733.1 hypothetical protein EUGRSUZ_H01525 [Eucalyptus grandis]
MGEIRTLSSFECKYNHVDRLIKGMASEITTLRTKVKEHREAWVKRPLVGRASRDTLSLSTRPVPHILTSPLIVSDSSPPPYPSIVSCSRPSSSCSCPSSIPATSVPLRSGELVLAGHALVAFRAPFGGGGLISVGGPRASVSCSWSARGSRSLPHMIPWGGLSCCLSAAALYVLGRSSGRDAEALKCVFRVNQLKELAQLLDTECKVLPLVVTLCGRVGSDTPINCEYSGLRGVIVEETAEQHFLKHNDAGSWIQDSALMLSMSKEVPWYLDDGTGRAYVLGARGASGFELNIASEVFEESGRSLVRGTLDYLQGLKMLGVKRIERLLPVGSSLTVVGEAVKDDIGTVRIQRPHKGPFYVSPKTIDQLISNLGKWARWYRYASYGFTVFGICLIAKRAIQYIMERKRRWELQRRVLAAVARRSEQDTEGTDDKTKNAPDSAKRDRSMPDLCVICLEQEYNSVFVPCGHMCSCTTCSLQLTNCPLCRRRIEQAVKTFRH